MRVALVTNPTRPGSMPALERLREALESGNHHVIAITDPGQLAQVGQDVDVAVTLGGDGTLLWAANEVDPAVPVLGINMGQLGYLARFGAAELVEVLASWPSTVHIEQRSTLRVSLAHCDQRPDGTVVARREVGSWRAVNDVVLERSNPGHVIRLAVEISGSRASADTRAPEKFLTMAADGLIFATPTGSTAYNLSMRGPIVSPALNSMVLTPVAPHATFDRSIVFGPQDRVDVSLSGRGAAAVVVDGRVVADIGQHAGEFGVPTVPVISVEVDQSAPLNLVVRPDESFVAVLRKKFGVAPQQDQLAGADN